MNWIDFSKRKPGPEPKRQLWVKIREKDNHVYYSVAWSTAPFDVDYITHWAEIEPPKPVLSATQNEVDDILDKWARGKENMTPESVAILDRAEKKLLELIKIRNTPTPDPLEEAWSNFNPPHALSPKETFGEGWDAALRWKEGQ